MVSLLQVSQSADALVISYPYWIAVALLAVTVALSVFIVKARRRWPVALAILFSAWGCVYVATFGTRLDAHGGSAYAFLRYDHALRWNDAADIYLEHGDGARWQIVVIDKARNAFAFDVADLSVEERDRVMGYVADRMPATAFAPELLRRHAPAAARPASFPDDQQI